MAHLSILVAEFGEDIPYAGGLARGFPFRGKRVPFLNYQKGIYRAAAQSGPAALSIQTSSKSPYDDETSRTASSTRIAPATIDQPDNRALRAAHHSRSRSSTSSGRGRAGTSPSSRASCARTIRRAGWCSSHRARCAGRWTSLTRPDRGSDRAALRGSQTRVRLHQARFRGRSSPRTAASAQSARLKELRLLDAAHMSATSRRAASRPSEWPEPLLDPPPGVRPESRRRLARLPRPVSRRLLEDEDGPMLDLLKGFHEAPLNIPKRGADRPDRERLDRGSPGFSSSPASRLIPWLLPRLAAIVAEPPVD